MKKKILLALLLVAIFTCLFAIAVSAETPNMYIEFGAKFPGNDNYITVYTENAESTGNPQINFATKKFYSDVDFTQEVDMSTATGIDFSVAKSYVGGVQGNAITRMKKPSSPFVNCVEVKWFLSGMPTVSYEGSFFKGWTGLKSFDFGNATAIADNTFEGCGFESITLPASITSIGGSAFKGCLSLKSAKFEGSITKFNNGQTFQGCTALETVDIGTPTYVGKSMFYDCTSLSSITVPSSATYIDESAFYNCKNLASIELPSTITEIKGSAFRNCTALTNIEIPENVTKIGNSAFMSSGITSLHIPAKVETLGYQVAEASAITSLTFAENSQLTYIDHRAFMDCDSLVGPVILPEGITKVDYGLFSGCALLKAVKLPESLTTIESDTALFSSCPKLEFVQFPKNFNGFNGTINRSMFENCSSLKAISLPEGITTIDYKALRSCTSLQAVYLPSTLTNLGRVSNYTASDWGVFYQSSKVYFVDKPFDVFDGDTLLGDNFKMPAKPDVYYMPSGLKVVGNSEFQNCTNLNNYIVFPEGVTSMADCGQGAFYGIGSGRAQNPVKLVFLGDITDIIIRQNETASSSNVYFVFANKNDKDFTSMNFIIGAANNRLQTNTFAYFCASNTVYDLSTFKAANSTKYTVLDTDFTKTVNTKETQPHFHSPRDNKFCEATCTDAAGDYQYCFCGAVYGFEQKGADALGHLYNDLRDQFYPENNYYANATCVYFCSQCNSEVTEKNAEGTKLFTAYGYSASEDDPSNVAFIVYANAENIKAYSEFKTISVAYGLVVSANTNGTPLTYADGSLTESSNTVKINMTGTDYNKLTVRVSNIGSFALHCNGYVVVGEELFYLNHATVDTTAQTITYAEMLELLDEAEGGTEEEIPEEIPAE